MTGQEKANPKIKGWWIESPVIPTYFEKNIPKTARILDVGAGGGHFLLSRFEAGYKNLAGTDLNKYLHFEELKEVVDFKEANLNFEPIPFPDASCDVVTSFHTFEHLENPFHFIRECSRVLKPGGTFILGYPYAWNLQSRILFLLTANVTGYRKENSHITFLTRSIFLKCFGRRFRKISEYYYKGKLKLPLVSIPLPSNKFFGNGVCYIFEKQYFADKPY